MKKRGVNVTNSPSLTAFESEFWRSPLFEGMFQHKHLDNTKQQKGTRAKTVE